MAHVESSVRRAQLIAAARSALARDGVAKTSLRAVAAEAGVPLGTMQYVFRTKEQLLRAVIEDVVHEIAQVLEESAQLEDGLAHAIREGVAGFWSRLVSGHTGLQLMQYELTTYALRAAGQESLARWQYERYGGVVAEWCRQAAGRAGETCAVPFDQLARVIVAGIDGLILQHVCDPDDARSRGDLDVMIETWVSLAGVRREKSS
ncbi:putative transcriptional regulator, TetR family protein [Amycolatopsis deserti]|uniref:Transcriptional regulator, TetR family protein n=1 Tax=Amycolatopsis deserti TaxID=185696 RepID=A0ABQ3J3U5_9PSEU|nr:TetR/AcrR family transcriptional regulator [Amycolatopsis deserti]GHF00466.1 putative transcriptional regulator, TetR family protein [Amycolatopsis deserti]